MLPRRIISLSSLLLLSATLCFASGDDEHRQHGSHVHGIGHMNLAVDGNDVYIELENPSANIVGFEHMPSSDNDRHAVHEAAEKLEDGKSLFIFTKQADCSLTSATVSSPLLSEDHENEHHNSEAHEEKHENDEHGSGEDHADHEEQAHSEFVAEYKFSCKHPEKLKSVETKLFSVFPGIEELETQVLTNTRQTGAELTAKSYRIDF